MSRIFRMKVSCYGKPVCRGRNDFPDCDFYERLPWLSDAFLILLIL